MTAPFFCSPAITISMASSKSFWTTVLRWSRTANKAPSLIMLASSAPLAPALALAMTLKSMLFEHLISLACNLRMASRPARSGSSTGILRSNRPGRVKAGSNESGRFVAASNTTPFELKLYTDEVYQKLLQRPKQITQIVVLIIKQTGMYIRSTLMTFRCMVQTQQVKNIMICRIVEIQDTMQNFSKKEQQIKAIQ